MNTITSSEIWERLRTDSQIALKQFPSKRILGTFLIGPANFGNATGQKDVSTVTIVLPTLEDIATNNNWVLQGHYNKQGGRIELIDFRHAFDMILNEDHYNEILYTEFALVNSMYKKTMEKIQLGMNMSYEERFSRCAERLEDAAIESLVQHLTKILVQYLEINSGLQEQFFDSLTKTEEKALLYVLETIGTEGNLSISQAVAYSGISRPIFTSLFDKLDRYHGAEIKNQGVKGTYICFYDHVLSAFNII